MATFQKRGNSWRAIVRTKGKSLSKSFATKGEAKLWAAEQEASIGSTGEPVASGGITAAEMLERYGREVSPGKKGGRWEEIRLARFARVYPLFQRDAAAITGPDIADWRDARLREVSASSVNRELCLLSAVFQYAIREWRLGLTVNPCSLVSKPRKPRARTQRVSQHERRAIIEQLDWDGITPPAGSKQWAAFAFYLALETAMRKGEILSLKWGDIHLEDRRAHLSDTKNGDYRDVPLSRKAMDLLQMLERRQPGQKVIPIQAGNLDKLFRCAKRDAGLSRIRFHDSRREAATTMATKLSNVLELAAVTGHKSLSMLQIYYRPRPEDLAAKLD